MIGPAAILAVLVGTFATALVALVRGTSGGSLPLVLLAAILGAWAGDSLGGRLGLDLLRLGDFRMLAAIVGAGIGIGGMTILASLGPERRRS